MIRRSIAVAGLALAACRRPTIDDVAFDQPEALPGFTVSLPAGQRVKSEVGPTAGEITITRDGAAVTVGWLAGRMPSEELPAIAAAMQSGLGAAATTSKPQERAADVAAPDYGTELSVATDKGMLRTTVVQCSASNMTVVLTSIAGSDGARSQAFHDRFVATLRCGEAGSAPSLESALPDFRFEPDLAYLPGSDPPAYFSLTGARWYVTPGPASARAAFENPAATRAMVSALGMTVLEQTTLPEQAPWLRTQLKVSVDGETGHMLMGLLTCESASYMVVYTAGAMSEPDPAALAHVRCPSTRIDSKGLPSVGDVFGRACERDDAEACARLSMLVEEEPSLLAGHDAAKLRARACSLGLTDFCAAR